MQNNAVALGTFDGLHIAHMAVLNNAKNSGATPICITFKATPKYLLKNKKGNMLLSFNEKKLLLKKMGFKIKTLNFNKIKNKTPEEFLKFINKKYAPKVVCCGFNYKFGKNALGNSEFLKEYFKDNAEVLVCEETKVNGETVSSSKIREYITLGEIEKANQMLGYEFSFESRVIKGDRRGRTIGFPTINQRYKKELVVPRFGAYITKTIIDNKEYNSITNIGLRPSFKTKGILVETHIIDFNKNIYGKKAKIKFVSFLRDETKFNSIDELKKQLEKDKTSLYGKEENDVWFRPFMYGLYGG